MIRNLAVAGGRQVKNEDLTHYIQAFTVFEQMFSDLFYGTFIVHGVNFTVNGSNFDISSGVIYYDGELCIFQGATNVSLPHRLRKERVGINPRAFQDTVVRNTAESVRVIADAVGPLQLNESTSRASGRFFRQVAGNLRAPIDANNNNTSDVWKPILSDRIETVRRIPQAPATDRYLQIGTIPIASTQAAHFFFSGVDANDGVFAYIKLKRVNLSGTDNAVVESFFLEGGTSQNERPVFYTRRNDPQSNFELWVKSPALLPGGEFTSGVVSLMSEDFTGNEDEFTFSSSFSWQSSPPASLLESDGRYYITDDELEAVTIDSGWLDVTQGPDAGNFLVAPQVRRVGKIVQVAGTASVANASNSAGFKVLAVLPSSIPAPTITVQQLSLEGGSGSNLSRLVIISENTRNVGVTVPTNSGGAIFTFNIVYISG